MFFLKRNIFKIVCLIFISLGSFSAFAQSTNLVVFSEQGERFWLVVNGIKQNVKAGQNVKVTDLKGDGWKLKVIFENQNLEDIDKAIYIMEKNQELTLKITENRKGDLKLRQFSMTPLQDIRNTEINPEQETITYHDTAWDESDGISIKVNAPGIKTEINIDEPMWGETQEQTGRSGRVADNPRIQTRQQNCFYPMTNADFSRVKTSIENQSFEEEKLNVAKQALRSKCIKTSQITEVLELFNFEESRLDFAKFAYDYTTDTDNYYQLNDSFNFSSSKRELASFLENRR